MLTNYTAYKYETPYKVPFVITQCFTNGTITLQCGATQVKYNMRRIKPYKLDTKVEYYSSKICITMSTYEIIVIYFYLKPNLGTKYMIGCARGY